MRFFLLLSNNMYFLLIYGYINWIIQLYFPIIVKLAFIILIIHKLNPIYFYLNLRISKFYFTLLTCIKKCNEITLIIEYVIEYQIDLQ
jgi:hypothetical protein